MGFKNIFKLFFFFSFLLFILASCVDKQEVTVRYKYKELVKTDEGVKADTPDGTKGGDDITSKEPEIVLVNQKLTVKTIDGNIIKDNIQPDLTQPDNEFEFRLKKGKYTLIFTANVKGKDKNEPVRITHTKSIEIGDSKDVEITETFWRIFKGRLVLPDAPNIPIDKKIFLIGELSSLILPFYPDTDGNFFFVLPPYNTYKFGFSADNYQYKEIEVSETVFKNGFYNIGELKLEKNTKVDPIPKAFFEPINVCQPDKINKPYIVNLKIRLWFEKWLKEGININEIPYYSIYPLLKPNNDPYYYLQTTARLDSIRQGILKDNKLEINLPEIYLDGSKDNWEKSTTMEYKIYLILINPLVEKAFLTSFTVCEWDKKCLYLTPPGKDLPPIVNSLNNINGVHVLDSVILKIGSQNRKISLAIPKNGDYSLIDVLECK